MPGVSLENGGEVVTSPVRSKKSSTHRIERGEDGRKESGAVGRQIEPKKRKGPVRGVDEDPGELMRGKFCNSRCSPRNYETIYPF